MSGDDQAKGDEQASTGRRSPWWVIALAIVGALTIVAGVVAAGVGGVALWGKRQSTQQLTEQQTPFYTPPDTLPAAAGVIVRQEPLEYSVPGGRGFRILYTSLDAENRPIAVSGRVFIPTADPPPGGRRILAWAHGTVGLADQCAPSRSTTLVETGWLEPALQQGLIVAATDYAGLGVPGDPTYLVGQQEARDVVYSVMAAQQFPGASASNDWIVYGSSQGGHSALWTAHEAQSLAPELHLRGVAAAVPAAELAATMQAQWQGVVGWVIGPYAAASWRAAYPDRDFLSAVSEAGASRLDSLAQACVVESGISAVVLEKREGTFFRVDPMSDPAWAQTVREQTPPPPPASVPMLLAQGMDDTVVLAGSNALLQERWCAAGVGMESLWLAKTSHQDTSIVAGPAVVDWAVRRFAGGGGAGSQGQLPQASTCDLGVPAPIMPLPSS